MTLTSRLPRKANAAILIACGWSCLLTALPCAAANIYWDGGAADVAGNGNGASSGGAGTWDNSIKNWDAGAVPHVSWNNTANANDTANFAGTTGIVTAGCDLTAGKLAFTGAYTLAGGGFNLILNGTGTAISGGTVSGFNTITMGASQTWAAAVGGGTVNNAGNTLTLGAVSVTSVISGTGGLTLTGSATLNPANTYTGVTTLNSNQSVTAAPFQNAGMASLFGAAAATSSNILINGCTLTCNNVSFTTNRGFTLNGACGFYQKNGTATISGTLTGSGSLSFKGDYNGSTGGNGLLVLAGANDYTGDTAMTTDCRIRLAHVNALSMSTLNATVGARSYWDLTTANLAYVIGGLKGSGPLALGTGLGGGGSGAVSFGNNNQSNIFSGVLSGTAGFTKIGTGTQTLSGSNSFAGPTLVSSGTLALSGVGALVNTPSITVAGGAILDVSEVTGGFILGDNQTLAGTGTVLGPVTGGRVSPGINGSGTLTLNNDYTQTANGVLIFGPQQATTTPALVVSGTANLNGTLDVTLANGYVPVPNDILAVLTANSIVGNFATIQLPSLPTGLDWEVITGTGSISLKVVGIASSMSVTPASHDFGGVLTGTTAQASLTVTNAGTTLLTGTASVTGTPFAITDGATYSLGPGASAEVVVTFTPSAVGHFTDAVVFTSTAGNASHAIAGSGIIPPVLDVSPVSNNIGNVLRGSTGQAAFVVSNSGGMPLTGTAAVGAPFAVISGATFTVNPGASANIVVQFAPGSAVGAFTDAVVFASNGGNASRMIAATSIDAWPEVPPDGSATYAFNPIPGMPAVASGSEKFLTPGGTLKQTFIPKGDTALTTFNSHDGAGVHLFSLNAITLKFDAWQNTPATFNLAISRVETGGGRTLLYSEDFQHQVMGQTAHTFPLANACLLSDGMQYELAVTLVQGGTNIYGSGIGGVGVFTSSGDYPDGACSTGGDLWLGLSAAAALPVFAGLSVSQAAANVYAFDAGIQADASSYDNLTGKLIGVNGHPEQLNFICPGSWPRLTFVLGDDGLASLQAQGGDGNYAVTLNGNTEGETLLLAKAGATVVGYLKLQSHPRRTINLSYSYVRFPGEANNALMGYAAGVKSYISNLYAKINVGINWTDNGVLTFEWDLNGDGSSYSASYDEVWSPMTFNVLPNKETFFSNLYMIRYNKDDTYQGGTNGGGTSMGFGASSTPPRGANVRVHLFGSANQYGSTLAHELGHNFGLSHTGVGTDPTANLMDVGRSADNLWSWQWKIIHNTLAITNPTATDHTLTYAAGANGTLNGSTRQSIADGADGSPVTAVPSPGYAFVNWTDGNTTNPRTDSNVTSDLSVTANFAPDLTDADGDGLSAYLEITTYHTNPLLADTDGDSLSDSWEVTHATNPKIADPSASLRIVPAAPPAAVEFNFNAATGMIYQIDESTDLVHWDTLEAGIAGQGGVITRIYQLDNRPTRYFRARRK